MLQSVIFDKKLWSLSNAKKWLSKHKLNNIVDVKKNYYRFRQNEPDNKKQYYTINLHNGIKMVFMI